MARVIKNTMKNVIPPNAGLDTGFHLITVFSLSRIPKFLEKESKIEFINMVKITIEIKKSTLIQNKCDEFILKRTIKFFKGYRI